MVTMTLTDGMANSAPQSQQCYNVKSVTAMVSLMSTLCVNRPQYHKLEYHSDGNTDKTCLGPLISLLFKKMLGGHKFFLRGH